MKVSDAFPSKYLKAADLQGRDVTVTIVEWAMEEIGGEDRKDEKPVLYFQGKSKTLALNITNANTIADMYGDEMDGWIGQKVTLYPARVQYKSKMVDAIRIREHPKTAAATPRPRPQSQPQPQQHTEINPPPIDSHVDMDDEIPF